MDVFLYNDVATPLRIWVVLTRDEDRGRNTRAHRVRCAVNKAEEVAGVEVAETNCGVDELYGVTESVNELALKFEAEVAALRADVEEEVCRGGDSDVFGTLDFAEGVEFFRSR